jgi:hypothetical protein
MHRRSRHTWRRMGWLTSRRPQPALVVALVALIAATGGTATALPGRNTVDRNDVKKNAIRSKAIKNGQVARADIADGAVTGAEIADGAVTGAEIADGAVGGADIAKGGVSGAEIADGTVRASDLDPIEPYHTIGAPGEPQFFNGGEGDCVWTSGLENAPGTAPPGFAKDALGRVWLRGVLTATAGPGGDGVCNPNDPNEAEDSLVFVLPPAYRPAFFDISGLAHAIVIASDAGAALNGNSIPPGGVQSVLEGVAVLEGVSIRAATGTERAAATRAKVSLQALRRLVP